METNKYVTISAQVGSYILTPSEVKLLKKMGVNLPKLMKEIRVLIGIKTIYTK